MTTKLVRGVTYHKSHEPLIMPSCEAMRKTKPLNLHYYNVHGHKNGQDGYVT